MNNAGGKNRRKQSRVPTRSGTNLITQTALTSQRNSEFQRTIDDPVAENQMMFRCEKEQTKCDLFWGLDKDSDNRRKERQKLEDEDIRSTQLETYYKNLSIYKTWDNILEQQSYQNSVKKMIEKELDRENHLMLIRASAVQPEQLVSSIWSNTNVDNFPASIAAPQSIDSIGSSSYLQSLSNNSSSLGTSSTESLPLHIDGMLQSKAIVKEASMSFSQTLKRLYHNSHPITESLRAAENINQENNSNNSNNKQIPTIASITSQGWEEEEIDTYNQHLDDIDGHVEHKWDQEKLMKLSFSALDLQQKGYLLPEDISSLSSNSFIHSLLHFTVLWVFIKKKSWSFFEQLFTSESSRTSGISEKEWIDLAKTVSFEQGVPLRRIRSDEEHQYMCRMSKKKGGGGHSSTADDFFTDKREFFLRRKLHIGDLIWGLHKGGVRWLPAVIQNIHIGTTTIGGSSIEEYDILYPLSQRELNRARAVSSSRQLLHLPSSVSVLLRYPQPFENEMLSSAYAFDLVDSDRLGMVPLKKLITSFRSKEFEMLLDSNLSLSIIFGSNNNNIHQRRHKCDFQTIPSLLPVFVDTFSSFVVDSSHSSSVEETDGSEEDWVSKADFLEFCKCVVEIKRYSINNSAA